jgi:NADP-dependent aldehyde dehydrogenase
MTLDGLSLLAGRLGDRKGKRFNAIDPTSGQALDPAFYEASDEEAGRAIEAAADAFDDFGGRSPADRACFLDAIADRIEELGDALIDRATVETGLPAARIMGERARTCGQLRQFAAVVREGSWVDARIDTALPERDPAPRPDLRRMLKPIGPVVVFGASNFPLAFSTAGGDTASAFAAGCPVVVKAHPAHPGTGELVGRAIVRAAETCGLPGGVFSLVHGGPDTGIALVEHASTAAVAFTGSHRAGRALFDAANRRSNPIPAFAEMSSVNPVFLLPGAVRERSRDIAQGLLASFTLGVGQFCTKPGLVFAVRGPDTDALLEALAEAARGAPSGTMLTAGIRNAFETQRNALLAIEGVTEVARASSAAATGATASGPLVAMTDAKEFLANAVLAAEVFGPLTLVILTEDIEEMCACADALQGQLTATLHGTDRDLEGAGTLIAAAERFAGRLVVNGFPTGVEVSPAMHHGGPYPATTDVRFTSVGTAAILRFARPVCYQGFAEHLLPVELRNANPAGILRTVNGELTRDAV